MQGACRERNTSFACSGRLLLFCGCLFRLFLSLYVLLKTTFRLLIYHLTNVSAGWMTVGNFINFVCISWTHVPSTFPVEESWPISQVVNRLSPRYWWFFYDQRNSIYVIQEVWNPHCLFVYLHMDYCNFINKCINRQARVVFKLVFFLKNRYWGWFINFDPTTEILISPESTTTCYWDETNFGQFLISNFFSKTIYRILNKFNEWCS